MMEKWWKSVYFPDLVICLQIMIPSPKSTILITTFQLNVPYSKWWSFDEDKSFGGGGSDCALPQISVLITPSNIHPFPSFKLINWFIIGYYGMPLGHCPKDKVLCMTWSCFSQCLHITWHFCTWTWHFPINIIPKGKFGTSIALSNHHQFQQS